MDNILNYSLQELKDLFKINGLKPFRAEQVLRALYDGKNFSSITNIPQIE